MRQYKKGPYRPGKRLIYPKKGRYRPSMGGIGFFSNYYCKTIPLQIHPALRWRK